MTGVQTCALPIFNAKLSQASPLTGPTRYQTYGDLDVELMTDHAPIISVVDANARIFNSARVGGYVYVPAYGADLNTFFVK